MNLRFLRPKKSKEELLNSIAALLTRLWLRPEAAELSALKSFCNHADFGDDRNAFVTQIAEPVELILKYRGNGYTFSSNTDQARARQSRSNHPFGSR